MSVKICDQLLYPGVLNPLVFKIIRNTCKTKKSGRTSVDRSTRATLSTYNTWIHVSRLQKIYHFQCLKGNVTDRHLAVHSAQCKQKIYLLPCSIGNGVQHCLASMDSDLEAFSRNPTDGSFVALAFQLATFTKYLNEVFLSY